MKKILKFFLVCFILPLVFYCDSGSSDSNNEGLIPVKVTIDGVEKTYYTDGYSRESPGYDVFLCEDYNSDESINEIYFVLTNDNNNMVKEFISATDDLFYFTYTDNYGLDYDADDTDTITVTVTEWSDENATLSFSGIVDGVSLLSESFTIPYYEDRKVSKRFSLMKQRAK